MASAAASGRSTSSANMGHKTITGSSSDGETISYNADRIIGNGSFGVVYKATVVQTGEVVAIKKVLQDKRFKNRELQIMRQLRHQNVVDLKHCFYSNGDKKDELYLNLVLEFIPETVYRVARNHSKHRQLTRASRTTPW